MSEVTPPLMLNDSTNNRVSKNARTRSLSKKGCLKLLGFTVNTLRNDNSVSNASATSLPALPSSQPSVESAPSLPALPSTSGQQDFV